MSLLVPCKTLCIALGIYIYYHRHTVDFIIQCYAYYSHLQLHRDGHWDKLQTNNNNYSWVTNWLYVLTIKVCPESRVTSQILLKNRYILCASKPSANMKKALPKVLAQRRNIVAKFTINLCTNAFVESILLNTVYLHFTERVIACYQIAVRKSNFHGSLTSGDDCRL